MIIAPGSTNVITYFKLVDPATGVPETALTIANLDATYVRDGAAAVKNDLSTPGGYTVISAHTDNAAIVVDATNAPGLYRVDWPDAAFAAGVNRVQLIVNGAAIDPAVIEVELVSWLIAITGDGVVLANTQPAIAWGQQKIAANIAGEGALDIVNANALGYGTRNSAPAIGQYNIGSGAGSAGQTNQGVAQGQHNSGATGQQNDGGAVGQFNTGTTYGAQNTGASGQVNVGTAGDGIYASGTDKGLDVSGTVSALSTGPVDQITDAVWDELLTGATHNIATSAGRRLRLLASNAIYEGTVVSATNNTVVLDAGASAVDGAYDPALIFLTSGLGDGQCRLILQYAGASRTAALDRNWKVNPVLSDTFVIVAHPGREHVNEGLAQAGSTPTTIVLNTNASAQNNAYVGQRVFIRSGTGEDQARRVSSYVGATKVATVTRAWDITPDTTSAYVMLPTGAISNPDIAEAVWDAVMASYVTPGTTGAALNAAGGGATVFPSGAINFTYTVTDSVTTLPIEGVEVWFSTDNPAVNIVWKGDTDAFGVARDVLGNLPALDVGVYFIWRQKSGYTFSDPDTETVS